MWHLPPVREIERAPLPARVCIAQCFALLGQEAVGKEIAKEEAEEIGKAVEETGKEVAKEAVEEIGKAVAKEAVE